MAGPLTLVQRRGRLATSRTVRPITFGPFTGVNDTIEPGEERITVAQDIWNGYIPDPANGSDVFERPGFVASIAGDSTTPQAIHEHQADDGTRTRLLVRGGKVYRVASDLTTTTDITPVSGMTLSTTARVYLTSFGSEILVNDTVNTPWRLTNFASGSPATATKVDYDGAGSAWVARGPAVIYAAKAFWIVASVAAGSLAGTYATLVTWSEEADASLGYRQSGYTNDWELKQTSTSTVYALSATDSGLYYFRMRAIGVISGQVNADFQTNATHDSVSTEVGTNLPATVLQAHGYLYFADSEGKPWRLAIGGSPEPLWQQMRAAYRVATDNAPGAIDSLTSTACACYVSDTDVVLFALWPQSGGQYAPGWLYAFDGRTGRYVGRWGMSDLVSISGDYLAIPVSAMGRWHGSSGNSRLVLGAATHPSDASGTPFGAVGAVWYQRLIAERENVGDTNAGIGGTFTQTLFRVVTTHIPQAPFRERRVDRVLAKGTFGDLNNGFGGSATVTLGLPTTYSAVPQTIVPAMVFTGTIPLGVLLLAGWQAVGGFGPGPTNIGGNVSRSIQCYVQRKETTGIPMPQTSIGQIVAETYDAGVVARSIGG